VAQQVGGPVRLCGSALFAPVRQHPSERINGPVELWRRLSPGKTVDRIRRWPIRVEQAQEQPQKGLASKGGRVLSTLPIHGASAQKIEPQLRPIQRSSISLSFALQGRDGCSIANGGA